MVRKSAWVMMVVLAVLVAIYAIYSALIPGMRQSFVVQLFAEKPLRTYGHLLGGGVALLVGGLQFSRRIRLQRTALHRTLGKLYLVTVAFGGVSALLLAPESSGGITGHFGFGMLAVLWLTTSAMAYHRVRTGDIASHREWMIRSYALCLAAVTLRIYLPLSQVAGIPFEEAYPAIAFLCWVPNLILAEWVFVRGPFVRLDPSEG